MGLREKFLWVIGKSQDREITLRCFNQDCRVEIPDGIPFYTLSKNIELLDKGEIVVLNSTVIEIICLKCYGEFPKT